MSDMPNYLAPQGGNQEPSGGLIRAFRTHFSQGINVGGTEQEFFAEFEGFRKGFINAALKFAANRHDSSAAPIDASTCERIKEDAGKRVDQLLYLVLGMGQLGVAYKLIPLPAPEVPREVAPEPAPVASSSKTKTRQSRRFTHVLNSIITKNFKDPGDYGIPEEVKNKVPGRDGMIAEMVAAMKDESAILDFPDTKPYKDHWRMMKEPEFLALANNLFFHLNRLHQGVDYIEGFRYTDRYQNLISLLQKCKGTIYFMSRPSTYEDVLLNPHMMQLRFADNQKNNAKKKIDNRELTERRNKEFTETYGYDPPPKERGGKKRAISEVAAGEDGEASSPAPKRGRRKGSGKKGKAVATADVVPISAPVDNGEGSSTQAQSPNTSVGSPAFLGRSAHEYYQSQGQGYYSPRLQEQPPKQQQQYYYPPPQQQQQQQLPPQQYQASFNPQKNPFPRLIPIAQKQPVAQKQQPASQEQQSRSIAKARGRRKQTPTPTSAAPPAPVADPSIGVEHKIATTLSNAIQGVNYTQEPVDTFDSSYFSNDISPVGFQQQQRMAAGYQDQSATYLDMGAVYDGNLVQDDDQDDQFENFNTFTNHYTQPGPEYQDPSWYIQQHYTQQTQAESQPVNQQPRRQQIQQQKPQNQQAQQARISGVANQFVPAADSGWSGGNSVVCSSSSSSPGEAAEGFENSPEMLNANSLLQQLLASGPLDMRNIDQQGDPISDEEFNNQLDILEGLKPKTEGDDDYAVDMNAAGFGDLCNITLSGVGSTDGNYTDFDFGDPNIFDDASLLRARNPALAPPAQLPNSGGQTSANKLGGQNKMKQMDEMLALDP